MVIEFLLQSRSSARTPPPNKKGRKENKMDFKLSDLFDLESARIANAELAAEEEAEKQLQQPCSDLPGQFTMLEDNENV